MCFTAVYCTRTRGPVRNRTEPEVPLICGGLVRPESAGPFDCEGTRSIRTRGSRGKGRNPFYPLEPFALLRPRQRSRRKKEIHPRLIPRARRVTVCREVKWALLSAARPQSAHRGHHTHRGRPPAPHFLLCRHLPHFFGFGLHFAASLRRAHGANPPRRSRDSRHPFPCHKPRG